METSAILQYLETLKAKASKPMSHMDIIRQSLRKEIDADNIVPMPPLLNDEQRKLFIEDVVSLEEFIRSEDGTDAIELLMMTFKEYKARRLFDIEAASDVVAPELETEALPGVE